jgi:hypothetical protein
MIKKLTELRPEEVPAEVKQHIKLCVKLVKTIDEDDVKKESLATLLLFRWLSNWARVSGCAPPPCSVVPSLALVCR